MDLNIKTGVLVVGSLYWDESEVREKWRKKYLDLKNKQTVHLPICYGRESSSRNDTCTIVYSTNTQKNLGTGFIIPTKTNPINTLEELNDNVVGLINAERNCKPFQGYYWDWGAVGFKLNPKLDRFDKIYNTITDYWKKRLNLTKNFDEDFQKFGFKNEASILNNFGELQYDWPEEIDQFDFIITTVPEPNIPQPSPQQIVKKMCDGSYYEYFFNNIVSGINTNQDEQIWAEFKKYLIAN